MNIYRYYYILFFLILYSWGFGGEHSDELVRKIFDDYKKIQEMSLQANQSAHELSEKVNYVVNNIEKCNQCFGDYNNSMQKSDFLIDLMNNLGKQIKELMGIWAQNIFQMESFQKLIGSVPKDMQNCRLECEKGEGKAKKFYESMEKLNNELSDFEKKRLHLDSDIETVRSKINTMNQSVESFVSRVSEAENKMNSFQAYCKNFLSDTKNINDNLTNLKKNLEEIEKKGKGIDSLATKVNNINKLLIETKEAAIKVDEKLSKLHDKTIPLVEQNTESLKQALQNIDSNIIRYNNNLEDIRAKNKEFNKEVSILYPLLDDACTRMEKRKPLIVDMLQVTDKLTEGINRLHAMLTNTENSFDTVFNRLRGMNEECQKYNAFLTDIGVANSQIMSHYSTLSKMGDTIKVITDAYDALDLPRKEEMVKSLLSQCERLEHMTPQLEILIQKLERVDSHKLEHFVNLLGSYDLISQKKMDELIDDIDKKVVTEIMVEKKEIDANLLSHLSKMEEELRYTKYVTIALCGVCLITPLLTCLIMRSFNEKKIKKYRSDKIMKTNYNEAN